MNHKALITIFLIASIGSNLIPPASAEFESIRINEVFNGYVLFAPEFSKETYLIDIDKNILHTWESDYVQALGTYLMENGNLIRSCAKFNNTFFKMGGFTGRVEMYDWNGSLIWEFDYSNENHCLHHDLEVLPNGNILMIAWESKSQSEAIQAGINLSNINGKQLWADYIIEVKPLNSSEGEIVWEWHVWDHLIQEYDSSKDNFGIISLHPELIDINSYKNKFNVQIIDFNHINSIDYNEELDQILLSSRQQNEIWIIDHSTTTEEAAGHTGGRYGKGGDLLYR